VNYGGRQEIVEAVNRSLKIKPSAVITEASISNNLFTAGLPEVDLIIRTSGECRISNFLLWQLAYAELIFTSTLWPDYKPNHLYKSVYEYQNRTRRFGGL
jgi:undecaprenyl diphosphate synthase